MKFLSLHTISTRGSNDLWQGGLAGPKVVPCAMGKNENKTAKKRKTEALMVESPTLALVFTGFHPPGA